MSLSVPIKWRATLLSALRRPRLALLALAVAACGDGTGPNVREGFAGTWDLVTVDGQPLPFQLAPGPPIRVELTAIELDFPSSGTSGVESRSFLSTPSNGDAPSVTEGTTEVGVEVDGDEVTIINIGSGLPDDVGTLSDDDELTISRSVLAVYRVHVYRKRP